jgi:polysaccharide export outer membrane protein
MLHERIGYTVVANLREIKMKYFNELLIGLLVMGMVGCASHGPANLPPQTGLGAGEASVLIDAYKMDVGDQVQITVWKNPDLSVSEPIRPDGMVAVPLVGDIMAAGLGPEELAENIEKKLRNYVKNPNVTVVLTSLEGHMFLSRVRVTGSVGANTALNYHQGMTVLDAILGAGSVSLYADANRTKLHRRTEQGTESYDIRVKDILENGDMTTNVYLMPGDIITVPERTF